MRVKIPTSVLIHKPAELPVEVGKKQDTNERLRRSLANSERVVEIATSIKRSST